MKKEDIPDRVWKLFERDNTWIQGHYAKTEPDAEEACLISHESSCFCAIGGIRLVYSGGSYGYGLSAGCFEAIEEATEKLANAIRGNPSPTEPHRRYPVLANQDTVIKWNDAPGRTVAEVVALCKEADV